jgi:acetylglutamate kinase
LKQSGTINEGMVPKMDNAFASIEAGVSSVKICHYSALASLFDAHYTGTTLKK